MQRLMRAAIGTHNIDNCSRVCHSPTSWALRQSLGLSGATGSFDDIEAADAAIIIGANPTEGHPVVGARIKQATLRGLQLVTIDPRRIELSDYAVLHLSPRPGSNAAVMLGLAHVVARDGLVDRAFLDAPHRGLGRRRGPARRLHAAPTCSASAGIPAADLERAAHIYAEAGEASHPLGPRRDRAQVRLGGRAAHLQPRADVRQGRPAGLGAAAAARAEQRPGLVGHGRAAGHVHRLPVGHRRGRRAPLRGALGRDDEARARPEDPRDVRRRGRRRAEGDVHLRRGRRADRPEHDARRRRAARRSSSSSCRTSSRTRRRATPTSSCPPRRSSRRAARSRTPSGASSSSRAAIDPPGEARTDFDILTTISAALGHEMRFATPADVMDEVAALTPDWAGVSHERARPRRAAVAGRRRRHRLADPLPRALRAADAAARGSPRCPTSRRAARRATSSRSCSSPAGAWSTTTRAR